MTHPMTPEQEEQVRQALAAAARAEDEATPTAMPPEVAARLDGVLAELVQGRTQTASQTGAPADHDELARHRSRRRLNVLVAAAAVAVIAAAGGTVMTGGLGGGGGSDSASTTSSDSQAGGAYDEVAPQPEAAAPSASAGSGSGSARTLAEPRLRTSSLTLDVRRLARSLGVGALADRNTEKYAVRPDASSCGRPAAPPGADVVDVRLDGKPATLVLDRAADGTREARVYSCADASTPTATTTVPTR